MRILTLEEMKKVSGSEGRKGHHPPRGISNHPTFTGVVGPNDNNSNPYTSQPYTSFPFSTQQPS